MLKQLLNNISKKPAILIHGRFCFILLFLAQTTWAQPLKKTELLPKNLQIAENIQDNWYIYNAQSKNLENYLQEKHNQYHSIHLFLNQKDNKHYQLAIEGNPKTYIFVNARYFGKLNSPWHIFNINKLPTLTKSDSTQITLYSQLPFEYAPKSWLVHTSQNNNLPISETVNLHPIKPRKDSNFPDFIAIITIFLLTSVAFVNNFQENLLQKFINLRDLFTIKNRIDGSLTIGPFLVSNIFYLLLLSLGLGFTIVLAENNFGNIVPKSLKITDSRFISGQIYQFLNLSFIIFLVLLLKYYLIGSIASLFKLDKIQNLHYFKNIQALGIFCILCLFILLALNLWPTYHNFISSKAMYKVFTIFFIIRLLLIFFVLKRVVSVNFIYLFSYLCVVEIIPILIGLRLVL
jgi:hypothetical protein